MMILSRKAKEAIKTALAMTGAYGIALSMGWDKPMWAGLAVAVVSLATVGQSFNKAALRMFGTLVGAVVALALIALFPQARWLFMLFLSTWVGFCTYMMGGAKLQDFWHVCGFVCVIVCMSAGPDPINAFHLAILRTQETGLGVLVYSLVALFLWPSSSRAGFDETARTLASTQHQLYRAYRNLMSGQGGAEEAQALRAQEVQVKARFDQLLDAAEMDSIEVREMRRQWRRHQRRTGELAQTMARWRESLAEVQALDLPRLLPNLAAFCAEIDLRFAQLERMLANEAPEHHPAVVVLDWDEAEVRDLPHFHRAALAVTRTSLQRIEALTRSMVEGVSELKGFSRMRAMADAAPPPRGGFMPDPDRMTSVVRIMATLWLAYLALIYVNDLPGGTALVSLSSALGMVMATTPQLAVSLLFVPVAVGVFLAGLLYIFVMPQLSSFLGLGPLIFAVTFAFCYRFADPRQALGRAFGLVMFVAIASISNQQTYSFLVVANTALMFPLIFLLLAITSHIPVSPLPERAYLRLLGRFFHSCEDLMSTVHRDRQRLATRLRGWRKAIHAREVATLPRKLAAWGRFIDPKALPGTSPGQVQAVTTSLQALSYRMQELLEAGGNSQADFLKQELDEDARAWSLQMREAFKLLSKDPAAREREAFRTTLAEVMERLETRIEETLDQAAEGQLRDEDGENFYRLLGGYRGLSEALVDYAGSAAGVDWSQWREERFA